MKCIVPGCKTTSRSKGIKMHSLPKNLQLLKHWCNAVGRPDLIKFGNSTVARSKSRLCSLHFETKYVIGNSRNRCVLHTKAVPTLMLPANVKNIQERNEQSEKLTTSEEVHQDSVCLLDEVEHEEVVNTSLHEGFTMNHFPNDSNEYSKHGLKCATEVNRANWNPNTDYSISCENHFTSEMSETARGNASENLQCDVVPTIFPKSESLQEGQVSLKTNDVRENQNDTSIASFQSVVTSPSPSNLSNQRHSDSDCTESSDSCEECFVIKTEPLTEIDNLSNSTPSNSEQTKLSSVDKKSKIFLELTDEQKLGMYEKLCQRQRNSIRKDTLQIRKYRNAIRRLTQHTSLSKQVEETSMLEDLFNDDQIVALRRKSRNISTKFMRWSNATLEEALKLKSACGPAGYMEVLKQGIPLPSLRSLQRMVPNENVLKEQNNQY